MYIKWFIKLKVAITALKYFNTTCLLPDKGPFLRKAIWTHCYYEKWILKYWWGLGQGRWRIENDLQFKLGLKIHGCVDYIVCYHLHIFFI